MSIKINLGAWNSVFVVPSKVVDEGLKFADGVKLKVLLYVLRNSGNEITEQDISKGTGVNVIDIPEVLDYWVSLDIFTKSNGVYTPSTNLFEDNSIKNQSSATPDMSNTLPEFVPPVQQSNPPASYEVKENVPSFTSINAPLQQNIKPELSTVSEKEPEKENRTVAPVFSRPAKPDYVYTSQRLAVDEELKILVEEVQIALGKTLSNSDVSSLLMLKDTCGLPLDVILMLVQYCISIDKGNIRNIEKIGVKWADEGIYTLEAADNKIMQTRETSKNFSIVSSVFGLVNVGSPTKRQLEFADKWVGEWKFSPEMLREAYERCVNAKGVMKFTYIDGILKRWNSNNIRNIEELASFEKTLNAETKRGTSYDIDELEKIDTLDDY